MFTSHPGGRQGLAGPRRHGNDCLLDGSQPKRGSAIQSADSVEGRRSAVMLNEFAKDVQRSDQRRGPVIEVLPAGAVVGVKETLDAVDAGLVEGGFAWTHYWSGKHPAAMLFGSPVAGAGVGIDNIAFISWFLYGGGKELYDRLWTEMGVNIKGFMLQPVGPEALGWFKEPINSMEDFRKYRFRTPARHPRPDLQGHRSRLGRHGRRRHPPCAGEGHHRRGRVVLPEARQHLRIPEGAEALLPAGPAPGRRQRGHLHQRRCLQRADRPSEEGDRGGGERFADEVRWPTASTRTARRSRI